MNLVQYLKKNGLKHTVDVIYKYKLEIVLEKIVLQLTKKSELKNAIIIESHNDFDCNGGAFYQYLVENNYNKKYKIIWLVRKKVKFKLPPNVTAVPLFGPSLRKAYYVCTSKFFTFDCEGALKQRDDQIMVACEHGAGGLKKVKGMVNPSPKCDYFLVQSDDYAPIQADQWGIDYPNKKIVAIGYPAHDIFFDGKPAVEINKITKKKYSKTILWMPTFRKGGGYRRNDSTKEQKLGIPLIETMEQYKGLNNFLENNNVLLIIKIHPKQDLSNLGIKDMSNIKVLTGETVKKLNVDNYALMKSVDALISDYSGAAYEFLQLNRPIGYVLDDINEYKLGFVVEDIHQLIAGHEIYTFEQFEEFVNDIVNDNDIYKQKREEIRDYIYKYHDGHSCERLAKLMKL